MLKEIKSAVVIAPHPDDETLGVGGTMALLAAEGVRLAVLFVSGHLPPLYPPNVFETVEKESRTALQQLGVSQLEFLRIPALSVSRVPTNELNGKISHFILQNKADLVFLPFPDRHIDHRVVFDSSVVACRPVHPNAPWMVLAYETLSETHWNVPGVEPAFTPDFFVNISPFVEKKDTALRSYDSQIKQSPSRSVEASRALARFRGSQNGCDYAEAFKVVRIVVGPDIG